MSLATKYKQSRFRKVTLSTGDTIQVRPFSRADYIALGEIPGVIGTTEGQRALSDAKNGEREKMILDNIEFFERLSTRALTHCIVTPGFKIVVDKEARDCGEDEIHVSELADADSAAILSAVMEASGSAGKEAAAAATFRDERNLDGDTRPAGTALRIEPCLAHS